MLEGRRYVQTERYFDEADTKCSTTNPFLAFGTYISFR